MWGLNKKQKQKQKQKQKNKKQKQQEIGAQVGSCGLKFAPCIAPTTFELSRARGGGGGDAFWYCFFKSFCRIWQLWYFFFFFLIITNIVMSY